MNTNDLERKYNLSRLNLLILVGLSVVNMITLVLNDSYFFFSLSFPRNFQLVYVILSEQGLVPNQQLIQPILLLIMVIPIVLFLLCYIFSNNNRYKIMLVAIILFAIDSIFTLLTFELIDIIFHIYISIVLIMGYSSGRKIAKLDSKVDIMDYDEDDFKWGLISPFF